ncbi:MAG TPA: Mrp/NBP35 family ATP-binding protein [Bryobacteraceae bacterium]|nr:Mrp/NBP35 family ATP-binding protein [Bryobacteraceae bacterium]
MGPNLGGPGAAEQPKLPIQGVQSLIAVGSGKGGVGKTTVSVNLAIALSQSGYKVGLLDADVYGPNVPLMMGIRDAPTAIGDRIQPLEQHGIRIMSMGFLNPGDKPLIWRGPMLNSVIQQFVRGVDWGSLDFLVIDLPPGTGDVQLSLLQTAPVTGAVVVTTPSEVSLEDARKAVLMFRQLRVEVLGLVENMSYMAVPGTNQRIDVFGQGGGRRTAEAMAVPFLGELPLDPAVRIGGDRGRPVALLGSQDPQAAAFFDIAKLVSEGARKAGGVKGPKISIEE